MIAANIWPLGHRREVRQDSATESTSQKYDQGRSKHCPLHDADRNLRKGAGISKTMTSLRVSARSLALLIIVVCCF